jgi:TatD DNase family protein
MYSFFDAHTHVQFSAFKDNWREVIARAKGEGVAMINVGTQRDTSRRAIEIAETFKDGVYATVGLHPIHTAKSFHDAQELGTDDKAMEFASRGEEFDHDSYKSLAVHPKVVAIGECGLDYYRLDEDTKEKQKQIFLEQIQLSNEVKKPLMIHCREALSPSKGREAFPDLIDILKSNRNLLLPEPGVAHFFTGSLDEAKKLADLGFSFTFGGVITFARNYDPIIEYLPLDRILSETDAPYVAPVPYRGKTNEPAYVIEVVKKLAELKKQTVEAMAEQTVQNASRMFFSL